MGIPANFWLILGLALLMLCITLLLMRSENVRVELEQSQKRLHIIEALSSAYVAIMLVQLNEHTVEVIKTSKGPVKDSQRMPMSAATQWEQISRLAVEEYKKPLVAFSDMSTVERRLKGRGALTFTWQNVQGGWMLSVIVPQRYDKDGRLTSVLIANRDVTEEKERELAARRQAEKAAEQARRANAAKTDFLRRMSHDVRTPINGIRGMVEISRHYPGDEQKQEECRQKIMDASGFLLELVNNVLDMNKLESGEIQLEQVPFDLVQLVEEAAVMIDVQAREHGVQILTHGIQGENTRLIGSPVHLRQVLQNISGNAVKYTPAGGRVEFRIRQLSAENGVAHYEFICRDNGIGMSEEFQKHAFEPFAQEDASARTVYSGTGLGLAITKELVERMGGEIWFESTPGKGTTFYIRLPLRIDDTPVQPPCSKPEPQPSIAGTKVLLVEDNELNMEIAQFLLENEGATVTKAWNGQQAVDMFAASAPGQYDVILMDVMMPVMGGLDAARAIRAMERPDAGQIPILAMTANAFQDDVRLSREAGMNEHLTKPLNAQELTAAIARCKTHGKPEN